MRASLPVDDEIVVRGCRLTPLPLPRMAGVMALRGFAPPDGWTMPGPGRWVDNDGVRAVWSGRNAAFVLGDLPDLPGAAVTEQGDGWALLELAGPRVEDALARVTPLDVRASVFAPGHAARTMIQHLNAVLWRLDVGTVHILVFRSMAVTAAHDLGRAMREVAARADLEDAAARL